MMTRKVAGVDVGSVSTDVVILNQDKEIVSYRVVYSGANSQRAAEEAFQEALASGGVDRSEIAYVVSTGYGRNRVAFADAKVTEISCHARGAHFLFPETRTLIDVGGQDSKVVHMDERGLVTSFAMNDKCAAGTGRFLEVMARALELELDEMGDLFFEAKKELTVSSMCTVFAESEVISLISQGNNRNDIVAGIHMAIAKRVIGLLGRQGLVERLAFSGGVAKNRGAVGAFESLLKTKILVPEEPQIVGALGAALIALESCGELPEQGLPRSVERV